MDLCGPMRVASVNGKKYILVIMDDYSRFTWVKFLASKDEAPYFIIKFLKMIQVRLNAAVRNIRIDNGTEFVNQTLSGLVPNPPPSAPFVPPSRHEWDLVFQLVFDEFFFPPASVASLVPVEEALAPVESTDLPSSTIVDQDAPSPKSSSSDVIPTNVHSDALILEHLSKWIKDHPLQSIIGDPSRPVSTRLQLHEQVMFCYYDAFLTSVEPKTYKDALNYAAVRNIRIDNGTEFVNQTLRDYYEQLTAMAFEQSSLEPALHGMTPATPSSGLVPNPPPSALFVPCSRHEWDLVFQPVFDEFFSPPASIVSPFPVEEALAPVESTSSPSSITFNQDAPSPKSSSSDVIPTSVHSDAPISEHLSKWTKYHLLKIIISDPSRLVSIRLQLHEQALFCYYDDFLTSIEPNMYKDALTQSCCIEAMQEELNEFERLEVWELIPRLDKVMFITLKWIYKVKLD
ncbi:retrovirus-related pol polyprotein from transposon TNT 1-94 [Tanacetum coccineum]